MSEQGLPAEVLTAIGSPIRETRLRGVGLLARLAIGDDLAMAAAARRALTHLTMDDSRVVGAAAAGMLERTAVRLEPDRLDFGTVPPVTSQLTADLTVEGPPLVAMSTVTASGPGLAAALFGRRLRVIWEPRSEWLDGTITIHGPCGWAEARVLGRVAVEPVTRAEVEEWAAADIDPNAARVTVLVAPDKRRGGVALIATLVALVLLGGAGIAWSMTSRPEPPQQRAVAAPAPTPAASAPATKPRTRAATVPKVQLAQGVTSIATPEVMRVVPVGDEPEGVVVSPDGRTVFVANQAERVLSVVDARSGKVTPVELRNTPRFVATSRDGRLVYVSMYEDDMSGSGVAVVDATRRSVLRYVTTGKQPYTLAVAPDGRLWVPIHSAGRLEIYSADGREREGRIEVPPNPHAVAFSASQRRAFTANHESDSVAAIDLRTREVITSIPVSRAPHSVAVSRDGRTVLVAGYEADTAYLIDARTLRRTGPVKVGKDPQSVTFTVDGRHAYVVNEGGDSVSVLNGRTGRTTATVKVGGSPRTVAVSPDGQYAYVTNGDDDTLTVLRAGR